MLPATADILLRKNFRIREGDDVHRSDTMQELVSLSERFGIHVTFSRPDKKTFLHIVRHLAVKTDLAFRTESLSLRQSALRLNGAAVPHGSQGSL